MNQKHIQIKFVGHEVSKGVVMYKISLLDQKDSTNWVMSQRYSTMRDISKQLESENLGQLPDFPPKKWFGNMDEKFISQREKALENYFSNLLRVVNLDQVKVLRDFLYRNKNGGATVIAPDDTNNNRSQIQSVVIQHNQQNQQPTQQKPTGAQQPAPKVVNPQELWKTKMENIVSQVPFIDFVPFGNHDLNSQEKRNIYNSISFERKSKLLQNFALPPSTTDHSEQAIQAQPANVSLLKKLDAFAEKMHKALSNPLSNIYCDIVQQPNFC